MSTTSDAVSVPIYLPGVVQPVPAGMKGFDANQPVSASTAQAFYQKGYRFCVRYVGRTQMASYDLTTTEAKTILESGLALMIVQHVLNPGWAPSGGLGSQYGGNAAFFCKQLGVPPGVSVWCDLESVSSESTAADVIAYCNNWYDAVAGAGYAPGLYVGYEPGLTGAELYQKLKFSSYWGAYNVDGDETPLPRGWQLKQKVGTSGTVGGITTEAYDDDVSFVDQMGGQAHWLIQPS